MKLQLIEKKTETPDVRSFIFKPEKKITWKPGQFFHYTLHHRPADDRGSDRWFTAASAPHEGIIMLTTRFTADTGSTFKQTLQKLTVGKHIEISDLDGDFIIDDLSKQYVFIAGGIGITPFRSILKQLDHEKKSINVTLLYANHNENIVYKDELESMASRNTHLKIQYIFSPQRIDEKALRQYIPNITQTMVYISGPEAMVEDLGKLVQQVGVPEDQIKQDWFPGYPNE